MLKEPSSDETVEIATYANWNEAEIAKSFLEDQGIDGYIVGQEPHRGPEFAEGLRLRVLDSKSKAALDALRDADLLPSSADATPESGEAGKTYRRLVFWIIALAIGLTIVAILA